MDDLKEKLETIDEPKKVGLNPKILFIGLPLFIVQLVVVYFVTANVLLSKIENSNSDAAGSDTTGTISQNADTSTSGAVELGKFIYLLEEIIVNPAETDGKRLLLASVGFDVQSEEQKTILASKEILIKDITLSTLSSKSIRQLVDPLYRDSIRIELKQSVERSVPTVRINSVFFSKYIIQ